MSRFRELRLSPDGDVSRPGDFLVDAQLASKVKPPVTPKTTLPEPQIQAGLSILQFLKKSFLR